MASIEMKMKVPSPYTSSKKILSIDDADIPDIIAAFTNAVGPIEDSADSLLQYFASNIASQIQGTTQNHRTAQDPKPIPPVTITTPAE